MRHLCALMLALGSTRALAAGLYVGDVGTRGMARGGAFVARPDSLLAIHYNPAGLALLRGFQFELSLTVVDTSALFERTCPCVSPELEGAAELDRQLESEFRNASAAARTRLPIPFFGLSYSIPFQHMTFAFAAYGPHAGRFSFSALGTTPSSADFIEAARAAPQRYSILRTSPIEVNLAFATGMEIVPELRVGGELIVYSIGFNQSRHAWVNADLGQKPEDPQFDAPLTLSFRSKPALSFMFGISLDIAPGLSLGSALRWTRRVKAKGKLEATLPRVLLDSMTGQPIGGAQISGDDVDVELSLAPVWRVGLEYRLPEVFRLEVAAVYEGWSTQDAIRIKPRNVVLLGLGDPLPLSEIDVPRKWTDTFSLRVGGELETFAPWLVARGGYFFEPSAIPNRYLEPGQLDRPKHGFSLGLGTQVLGFAFDVTAAYVYLKPAHVQNSAVSLVGPIGPPLGTTARITTIGNGYYQGQFLMGSVGISRSFDL